MVALILAGSLGIVPLIIFLVVIGIALYFLGGYLPVLFRNIIIALICLALFLWLLDAFGIYSLPEAFHVGGGR